MTGGSTPLFLNSKITKYNFESEESVYPHFHHALEEHIDIALNRRVHTTTLERLAEIVENFMVSYADKQEEEKKIKKTVDKTK